MLKVVFIMSIMILNSLRARIADGLRYQSIRDAGTWATKFRVMGAPFPGNYSFKYHPWAREMLNWCGNWCGPKAAQMGYTEVALNRTFYTIDILKKDVMYVLPKAVPDAADFSAARFTPALELSAHLKQLFQDANNVGHKRAGSANLYVRGAQSRSGMKSIPASLMIFDELDEMPPENVNLGKYRMAGQQEGTTQEIKISTPSLPEFGIDKVYGQSTKEHFFFKCPCCSKFTEMTYPESFVITAESLLDPRISESHYICKECKNVLPNEGKVDFLAGGEWVKTENQDAEIRGFHIPQLYSMAHGGTPVEFAKAKLTADLDPTTEQEFFNSALGRPHVVKGARLERTLLNSLQSAYRRGDHAPVNGVRVLGVDVGTWIHYEVGEYQLTKGYTTDVNVLSNYRVLDQNKVPNFEDLDKLMRQWQIHTCVIDANPDRRKAREFSSRFPGFVYLCFYANGCKGNECNVNQEASTISVDRTNWLDASIGRFKSHRIALPADLQEEYIVHLTNLVRKYDRDHNGNPVGVWVTVGTGQDHFGHARCYAEIALPLALSLQTNKDISSFL